MSSSIILEDKEGPVKSNYTLIRNILDCTNEISETGRESGYSILQSMMF